jgi:predicted nuclease with TOPRIM domain
MYACMYTFVDVNESFDQLSFQERIEETSKRKAKLLEERKQNKAKYEDIISKLTLHLERSRKGHWCRTQVRACLVCMCVCSCRCTEMYVYPSQKY